MFSLVVVVCPFSLVYGLMRPCVCTKRGDIKIFDFGLVAELRDEYRDPFGLYHLTGMTGSPRYMAPGMFLRPWILSASL